MNTVQVVKDERTISVEAHHGGWAVITITVNGTPVPFSVDPEHRRLLADALAFGITDQEPNR